MIDVEPAAVPAFPRVAIIEDAVAPDVVCEHGQIVRDQRSVGWTTGEGTRFSEILQ
jgi:hypothetical protein